VELLEGALAAALDFRGWGGKGRRGEEDRRGEDSRTAGQQDSRTAEGRTAAEAAAGSARQTAPLALLLRQPEASVWSAVALRRYDRLTPPTFQPSNLRSNVTR
jgi:hypothetical protein